LTDKKCRRRRIEAKTKGEKKKGLVARKRRRCKAAIDDCQTGFLSIHLLLATEARDSICNRQQQQQPPGKLVLSSSDSSSFY